MANNYINENFIYEINLNQRCTIESNGFAVNYINGENRNCYNFEKLSWNASEKKYIGKIYFSGSYEPIDMKIINKNILKQYAESYNKQTRVYDSSMSSIENLVKTENIYNVIGTLQTNSTLINNLTNKYKQLYDNSYSQYIYRAARNNSAFIKTIKNKQIIVKTENSNIPFCPPIFSFDSHDSNPEAYFVYRGIEVPMKIVNTSYHNGAYSFIAIYPESVIKQYRQFMSSIQYINIIGNIVDNKIYYSNLSTDPDNLLYPISNSKNIYTTDYVMHNLQSSREFFEN